MAKIDEETVFIVNVKAAASEKTLIGLTIPGLTALADPGVNIDHKDLKELRRPQLTAFTDNRAQNEMHQVEVEFTNTLHKESQWRIENIQTSKSKVSEEWKKQFYELDDSKVSIKSYVCGGKPEFVMQTDSQLICLHPGGVGCWFANKEN